MLSRTKRGVSVMVGYVLLVTFVIILGIIVYQWMKTYVPQDELNCPDGVSIFIKDYECTSSQLTLYLKNNGKFNIGGYFIYATDSAEQELATIDLSVYSSNEDERLNPGIKLEGEGNSLTPNEEETEVFELSTFGGTLYSVEIVPIRWQVEKNKNRLVSCKDAKIRETISCGACTATCESLGYECGTWTICGASTDCGECEGEEICNGNGQCVDSEDCTDTCESLGWVCSEVCGDPCGDCELNNAVASCSSGTCIISECNEGYADCDSDDSNGCEVELGTDSDCSDCDDNCTEYGGTCSEGICDSCDGSWNSPEYPGVECDGGDNCLSNCTCEGNYVADGSGGCQIPSSVEGCDDYCVWLGIYSDGNCRQSEAQCTGNGEIYESEGDVYCDSGSPTSDTCCCAP